MHTYRRFFLLYLLFSFSCLVQGIAEEALTWQDCVKEAAKNHPDLISAQESIKQSEAAKEITSSTLFPQINSSVGVSRAKASASNARSTTTQTYTYGVTADQLLFDAGKTSNEVKAASENIKALQYNYRFTSSEVRFRLRSAFIKVLKAQELLQITEEIRKLRRDNLILITLRYESGIEHKGALLTAQANSAEAEFEIAQAKRALEVAQRELIKEMGRAQFSPVRIEGAFTVSDAALEKPDFEALAKNNPALDKLIALKNAASFGIKAAEANFFPTLKAQAGANRNSSRWPPENDQWNTGLTLSLPLFEGGLKFAETDQAKSIFNQAQADQRSEKDSLVVALEQTWAGLQDAVETVEVQKNFLEAAIERAQIAQTQYSLGLIQFDNWTIIEDDLVRTKKVFLDVQANSLLAQANWIKAKGETLEYAD